MNESLQYQLVWERKRSVGVPIQWQVAALLLLLVSLSSRIWIRVQGTDVGYELAHERQKTVALDMERRELELQLSVLRRPDSLSKEASRRLGLVSLKTGQAKKISF